MDSILIRQQIPNIPWTYNDTIQMPISDHALPMLGIRWRIGAPDTPYRKPQPSVSKWYATHFQRFTNTMSTRPVKTTDPPPPLHTARRILSAIADRRSRREVLIVHSTKAMNVMGTRRTSFFSCNCVVLGWRGIQFSLLYSFGQRCDTAQRCILLHHPDCTHHDHENPLLQHTTPKHLSHQPLQHALQ